MEVHLTQTLRPGQPDPERVEAVDFGYSEAFTDGVAYGPKLGRLIGRASQARRQTKSTVSSVSWGAWNRLLA